jgi:hypothetical protein
VATREELEALETGEVKPAGAPLRDRFEAAGGRLPPALSPSTVIGLQRTAGNAAVGSLISSSPSVILQRAKLADYDDGDPMHDPSRLSDADIQATDEYKAYMAMNPVPIPQREVLPEEAKLACQLLLRHLRQSPMPVSVTKTVLEHWLKVARSRGDVTATAEGTVGKQEWVQVTGTDVLSPGASASDFMKWMLAGGNQPNAATGKLNCWEMVLFSAYRTGAVTEKRLRDIYTKSKTAMTTSGDAMEFPRTLEKELRSTSEQTYDPTKRDSPRPLRGDLVIFQEAAAHVALATGRMAGGKVEVISHWPPPDGRHTVKTTTIEDLLPEVQVSVAKFWSPIW